MIVDTNSDVFFLNDSPSIKKTSLAGSATLGDTSQAKTDNWTDKMFEN